MPPALKASEAVPARETGHGMGLLPPGDEDTDQLDLLFGDRWNAISILCPADVVANLRADGKI
jgi:hypothetical protein